MAAKNKFLNAMKMPSIDDMFSSEADRQRESGDLVTEVPLSELHPFVGHPFEVRDDEDMQKLVDSIRENGVLTNLTVRRRAEGGYEIISGHRRFHAAQRAGLDGRNHHAASGTKLPPPYAGKTTQSGALKWQSTDIT